MAVLAAYPFIEVTIDTSGLTPVAQRSPGVIAVVGDTAAGAAGGTAAVATPMVVSTMDDAVDLFARKAANVVTDTPLSRALKLAIVQDPKPAKIYGVRAAGNALADYQAALASLDGVDDVTFVSIAEEYDIVKLAALKTHVENASAGGFRRIGVAAVNPATAKVPTYAADVNTAATPLKSSSSRMILVAARGVSATTDPATAAMASIAGFAPHISMTLKKIRGLTMPTQSQFSPSEIKALSEFGIIPVIDPTLIEGESLHFADARLYTTDADLLFIDIVRVIDDIEFRLKAGLIGMVGDARITKSGLTRVKTRVDGILEPLVTRAVIDSFVCSIPLLDILSLPESAQSAGEQAEIATARANRVVEMFITIVYGPAVHRLKVSLLPKF